MKPDEFTQRMAELGAFVRAHTKKELTFTELTYFAFAVMDKRGGSFAQALAQAWFKADPQNKDKIEIAFMELIDKYRDIAKEVIEYPFLDKEI